MNQAYQFKLLVEEDFPDHAIPDLLELYKFSPEKYPFLLESSVSYSTLSANRQSRYDILFIQPEYWLKMNKHFVISSSSNQSVDIHQTFLEAFDELWQKEQQPAQASVDPLKTDASKTNKPRGTDNLDGKPFIPFTGGWFVFFSYELAQQIEPTLRLPTQQGELPLAYVARITTAIVHDQLSGHYYLVAEDSVNLDFCYQQLVLDIQQSRSIESKSRYNEITFSNLHENASDEFIACAEKVKQYIREGDVFQVNLSRQWQARSEKSIKHSSHCATAYALYRVLRKTNPAPFSGLASFLEGRNKASIISSSPERLLTVRNNMIESRPIAGTRPRSPSAMEDKLLLDELHAHPKEQAEHIMLIDLIRNDLGRVSETGTVSVDEFMLNESYAHVHHIVSNVIGKKQRNITPGQVIKAIFPGGTITGCPKVRCMEIIAELEQVARGAYTGSFGYINLDGSMDLNILIRTMLLEEKKPTKKLPDTTSEQTQNSTDHSIQWLSFRAGAGLVADSNTNHELHETRAKAKGLLKALEPFLQAEHG